MKIHIHNRAGDEIPEYSFNWPEPPARGDLLEIDGKRIKVVRRVWVPGGLYNGIIAVRLITNFEPASDYTFEKPSRFVDRVFIHCSASDLPEHDDVDVIRSWHVEGNGWADVGYHYFITKDGTVQDGRSLEMRPAAQAGHNTGTIAICLHGLDEDKFTEDQFRALRSLCKAINRAYNGRLTFHGHREVAAKACPVFDYREVLGLDDEGSMK